MRSPARAGQQKPRTSLPLHIHSPKLGQASQSHTSIMAEPSSSKAPAQGKTAQAKHASDQSDPPPRLPQPHDRDESPGVSRRVNVYQSPHIVQIYLTGGDLSELVRRMGDQDTSGAMQQHLPTTDRAGTNTKATPHRQDTPTQTSNAEQGSWTRENGASRPTATNSGSDTTKTAAVDGHKNAPNLPTQNTKQAPTTAQNTTHPQAVSDEPKPSSNGAT
jgi:hypothetical protein